VIIVYTPKGGEPEHYDATSLRVSEAAIVQRTVDMKWQEILAGLEQDDLEAMRGIVWAIKKRSEPSLRWGDFDPGVTEMTSRMDNDEIERWLDATLQAIDEDAEWEPIERLISSRIPDVAADPEHALGLLAARSRTPKATAGETADAPPEPETDAEGEPSSPSQTSPTPGPSTSDSSPTSSTSHPETSMT
jgi:hypothetical protein